MTIGNLDGSPDIVVTCPNYNFEFVSRFIGVVVVVFF